MAALRRTKEDSEPYNGGQLISGVGTMGKNGNGAELADEGMGIFSPINMLQGEGVVIGGRGRVRLHWKAAEKESRGLSKMC